MALSDALEHNWEVKKPSVSDLTGFKIGSIYTMVNVLQGCDLGKGSRWVIKSIKGDKIFVQPLNAPSVRSARTISKASLAANFRFKE